MRVLVGMQPVLTQVPPKSLRSIMATFWPAAVRRPAREGLAGEAEGRSGAGAHDDAGDELRRDLAAGGGGALVVEDLAEGTEGEDADGDGGAEEGERGSDEADPAKMRGPADDGGGGEGA